MVYLISQQRLTLTWWNFNRGTWFSTKSDIFTSNHWTWTFLVQASWFLCKKSCQLTQGHWNYVVRCRHILGTNPVKTIVLSLVREQFMSTVNKFQKDTNKIYPKFIWANLWLAGYWQFQQCMNLLWTHTVGGIELSPVSLFFKTCHSFHKSRCLLKTFLEWAFDLDLLLK